MRVNFISELVRIPNVDREIFAKAGMPFTLELEDTTAGTTIQWFANADKVLNIEEAADGLSAKITASATGTSTLYLMTGTTVHKTLVIEVYTDATTTVAMRLENVRGLDEA